MWFIQTPVDGLTLPTDHVGRVTLAGTVPAWHHLIRDSTADVQQHGATLCGATLCWTIWGWQQNGSRVHVHDAVAIRPELLQMVRDEPHRACSMVEFHTQGKRQPDNSLSLHIVVPPEQFVRYQALVQLAMTLPSGMVALALPDPLVPAGDDHSADAAAQSKLVTPGTHCLIEGLEFTVTRAKLAKFSKRDLVVDRRARRATEVPASVLHDHGDEWLLFRREELSAHEQLPEDDISADKLY